MKTGVASSTVIAFMYRDGIIMASDTAAFYGNLAIQDITKIYKLNENCIVGFSGSVADIQYLYKTITEEIRKDTRPIDPQGIHKMIQRIVYSRRSELKLLRVSAVVCGIKKKNDEIFNNTDEAGKFIGMVNGKGNFWFDSCVATGIASHLILPVLRERHTVDLSKEEAIGLMEDCMRLLCYKDTKASNIVQFGFCTESESVINDTYVLGTNWDMGRREDEIVL
ncbi:20S proteasome subunit beta 7 [Pancytospora epiphaga]|nr:20S proteasome subunit beta 7 [Pancytospora epiphaga]